MRIITSLFSMLLLSLLLLPMMSFAAEIPPLQLFLDGKQLTAEVAPLINKDNKVMVPVRIIAESLGSKVLWEEKIRKVTVNKSNISIQMFIDKKEVLVNNKAVQLDTAPSIVEGNAMLPVRFISEQLGIKVTWDDLTRSVFLFNQESDNKVTKPALPSNNDISKDKPSVNPDGKDTTKDKPSVNPDSKDTTKDKPSVNPDSKVPDKSLNKPDDKKTDKPSDKPVAANPNQPATTTNIDSGVNKLEPVTVIQSISMEGDNFIVKTSGGKAIPDVTTTANPNRVQIDIPNGQLAPGLKLNANGEGFITEKNASVSQIRYLLFSKESSIVRIIIDLNKKIDFRASTSSANTQLVWSLSPAKERYTVVLDPGHGGKDSGTVSVTGRYEKDFVLGVGTKVYNLLAKEPKIEIILTRKNDTFIELPGRVSIANDIKADLFVSVHGNSTGKEEVNGIETYYYTEQSLPFAKLMHQNLLKSTGFEDRKVKQEDFHVIKNTTMPSLLLELGFLSNKVQENTMFQETFQNQVASAIAAGIKQQLKLE
ncbi:N-acetylmuramoyl-L-alanine amidase [Paenibacillus sp. 1_12]|uniref:N-acetylmuramoyl-L-alanine amidase family protein n=1 Tax=Paenibacillus sp. 1_12 TaxID=1566278 RepID=UPI0008EC6874|nr:N-acetylmuramoyl-L-alanine amidase family protein [Paenibacillus sp. 1_12]SFK90937.1 N-acetylmuramoyl-L-alanine amidase [Paenibacillus sp. 1_12]